MKRPADRLAFVRKRLNFTFQQVSDGSGIALTTCKNMEYGVIGHGIQNYVQMANFYNRQWQERFTRYNFPCFDNKKVTQITLSWLILGHDYEIDKLERYIIEIQEGYEERELNYVERIAILENRVKELENEL